MKLFIFTLLLSITSSFCSGQIALYGGSGDVEFDLSGTKRLQHVMRQEFSRIINTNANGVIGNYVGISTNEDNLSFAYNWLRKYHVWEVNCSGRVKEGISTIASNSALNTDVNLGAKFHQILSADKITISSLNDRTLEKKAKDLQNQHESYLKRYDLREAELKLVVDAKTKQREELNKRRTLLISRQEFGTLDEETAKKIEKRKKNLDAEIRLLETKINNSSTIVEKLLGDLAAAQVNVKNPFAQEQFEVDKLKISLLPELWADTLTRKKYDMKSLEALAKANTFNVDTLKAIDLLLEIVKIDLNVAEENLNYLPYELAEKSNAYSKERKEIIDKLNNARTEEIRLSWVSLGASVKNESFSLFDQTLSQDAQIYKENDLVPSINASVSRYINEMNETGRSDRARNIQFVTIGGNLKYGNNLAELKQVDIQTTDSVSPSRVIFSTQKAYQGRYKENIAIGNLFADYYMFVGAENNIGIHLRGTVNLGPFIPVYSVRGGLLVAALKRDDTKSILQFEVFYGLNNIFKTGAENNLLSRNVFGLQTTFPLNFNF